MHDPQGYRKIFKSLQRQAGERRMSGVEEDRIESDRNKNERESENVRLDVTCNLICKRDEIRSPIITSRNINTNAGRRNSTYRDKTIWFNRFTSCQIHRDK